MSSIGCRSRTGSSRSAGCSARGRSTRARRWVALRSPGPIVRWGGHSQGADPLAGEIGAFFGRLMVPVDFEPGTEAQLAGTSPEALYAAFVRQARDRAAASRAFLRSEPRLAGWLTAEATRLAVADPEVWAAAPALLAEMRLSRP